MKKFLAIILVVLLAFSAVACSTTKDKDPSETSDKDSSATSDKDTSTQVSTIHKVMEKGTLVVGCSPVVEGVCYQDPESGKFVGMIPDIINGYAEQLGVDVKWEPLEWSSLIPAVNTGKVDMIAAHMTVTIPRTVNVTFTSPWIVDSAMACVRTDSELKTLADLDDPKVKIGSGEGSSYNELIPELFPKAELVIMPTTAWQDALKTGRIDAMFDDSISFPGPISRSDGKLRLIPEKANSFRYSFGVKLNDMVFKQSLDTYLSDIRCDGIYAEIYKKWFGIEWEPMTDGTSY